MDLRYCVIDWFALETNRNDSFIFEIVPKYSVSDSLVYYEGYSISSKGFLPFIWIKFVHSSPLYFTNSLNANVHSCHFLFDHFQFALIHGPAIPGSYAILLFTALDLASITSHIHSWVLFLLWLHPFILSGVWIVKNTNLELGGGVQARYVWESSVGEHMLGNQRKQKKD